MILLQTQGSNLSFFLMMGGMIIIFYFFMIRPQQKRQKEQAKFRDEMKPGDRVVTIGGLHGRIDSIQADTITLDVGRGTKLTFDKSSISVENTKKIQTAAPAAAAQS